MSIVKIIKNGILDENPTFVQVIGMCPVLAVTTSVVNGIGMGLATLVALTFSNLAISLLSKMIPDSVRIPCYVVVIASLVTVIQFLMEAYAPSGLINSLGIFLPLIAVNCIIFARAESFASKNKPLPSFFDGIGMGLGFTLALTVIGAIRELLGTGSLFGINLLPGFFPRTVIFILPPGAFITLGLLIAGLNYLRGREKKCRS